MRRNAFLEKEIVIRKRMKSRKKNIVKKILIANFKEKE
jgi:hypothetical protein